jgi:Flp pilus assembly protein TadD
MTGTGRRPGRWMMFGLAAGFGLAAIALAAWLGGEILRDREARALAAEARAEADAGRLEAAEVAIGRWLALRPDSAEAHFERARIALARGRGDVMTDAVREARRFGHDPAMLDRLEGLALARMGQADRAEPLLRQTLEADPAPDPEVARALTVIYLNSYRLDHAAAAIGRWLRDSPEDADAYGYRVELIRRTEAPPAELIPACREVLGRDPGRDDVRLVLADALRLNQQEAEAGREYRAFLERSPGDPSARFGLGCVLLHESETAAREEFDRALAADPGHLGARKELAKLALRLGDPEEALRRADEAAKAAPFDAECRQLRAQALARLGRKEEARADQERADLLRREEREVLEVRQALLRDPSNHRLRLEVARWMVEHGQEVEGARWAELVLREDGDQPEAHRLLAEHFERAGEPGLANFHRMQSREVAHP